MKRLLFVCALTLGVLAILAAPALASAKTIVVAPSNDASGAKDTLHLQQAFTAAGAGGTVQLTAGHFTINDILVTGFKGTFKGAGQGKTVIGCPDGGVSLENGLDFTYLLGLQGGAITVSDMSFDITSPAPAAPWGPTDIFSGSDLTFIETVLYLNGQSCAVVDRVSFTGYANDDTGPDGYNADESVIAQDAHAFAMYGCTCATYEGLYVGNTSDARVTIGGTCGGNVFDNAGPGCALIDCGNSQATVCDNRFISGGGSSELFSDGVYVGQDPGTSASHFLINGNAWQVLPPADALDLLDGAWSPGSSGAIDAVVSNNTFALEGSLSLLPWTDANGIGEYDTQNAQVLANRFTGQGTAAVCVGTWLDNSDTPGCTNGWRIIGNDVRHMIPLPQSNNEAPGAPIWLGPGSAHCLVVGGPPPTYVFNAGTDNTLINATQVPDPSGAAAAPDKLTALKEMKRF